MWENRLKKTTPSKTGDKSFKELGDAKTGAAKPAEFWEIKMAWSEYRNGKWTQKQVSAQASVTVHKMGVALPFYHPFVHELLGKLATGNLDAVFAYYLTVFQDMNARDDSNFGSAMQGIAHWMQTDANKLSFEGTNSGRKGGFLRQLQDRVQQANIAGYEIKNIDKQMLAQQIRISIANQEITNQQKQIDNAQGVEDFLRNKYTNEELFTWMAGQVQTLYYQAYTLAYDLAKRAEKVFRFERGLTTSNFIQFGYWDVARDGLLAGERLYIALKQLEAAYQEKRAFDYEVSKPVSLRQVNPLARIQLKETGTCEFALPEVLFDDEA